MPDRYGDNPDRNACTLCDAHGLRDGFACDHVDWAAASKRGMAMVKPILDEIERKRRGGRHQTARPHRPIAPQGRENHPGDGDGPE